MENRRQFSRILFSINAHLEVDEVRYPVSIHDISLNGALISNPQDSPALTGRLGELTFELADGESFVSMHIAVIHQEEKEMGLRCNAIDIESVTHLRRLVELNLGDETQLNKELYQLTSINEHN